MNSVKNFAYTVNPDSDEPIMLIDKHIGYDEKDGYGIMGDLFQKELLALDEMGKKRIQVWINSPGGIVADGYSIYNAILKSKTKVDTYCTGMAASIAGVIFQAGRKRIMCDFGILMYHNPYGGDDDGLEAVRDSLAVMVASRCDKEESELKEIMKKTTFISAAEAFANGFCDEVEYSNESNKKRSIKSESDMKAFWKEATLITNSLMFKKNYNMKNIANKLRLNPEASEEAVVSEIDAMQAKIVDQATSIKNSATELEKKTAEYEKIKDEFEKVKDELEKMKQKAKNEEEEKAKAAKEEEEKAELEKEEKAKNMIEGFVKDGRIKNDAEVIKGWTAKAKNDLEGIKSLIEGLPISRTAHKIITPDSKPFKGGSLIATTMMNKYAEAVGAK